MHASQGGRWSAPSRVATRQAQPTRTPPQQPKLACAFIYGTAVQTRCRFALTCAEAWGATEPAYSVDRRHLHASTRTFCTHRP